MKALQNHFKRAYLLLALGLMGLLVALSACGSTSRGTHSATPTPTNNQSSVLAALPLLRKSIQATSEIQSAHLTLQSTGTIQTAGGLLPKRLRESAYTLSGQADIVPPKSQEQGNVEIVVTPPGQQKLSIKASEIVSAQKLYIEGANKHWSVLNLAALPVNDDLRMRPSVSDIVTLLQHVKVIDHGIQVEGQFHLHHLTITVDTQALNQMLRASRQPMLKLILNNLQIMAPVSIDVLVDEMTGLPHQIELKGKAQINIDALLGIHRKRASDVGLPARTVTLSFDTTATLSNVNKEVTIHVPTKATPLPPSIVANI
jgi:hypothetical protein